MEELTQNNIAINSDDANRRIESSADYRKEVVSGRAIGSNRGGRTVSTLAAPTRKEFVFVNPNDIPFDGKEEWLIKGVAPKTGVMALWGKSGVGKTFIALDMARRVAAGWPWAGLRVKQGLVAYICAEGHGGFPKRIEGHRRTNPDMPRDTPFRVLNEAPNLGTESGDLEILIKGIDRIGEVPALIVIDTLAQTLGNGDENGPGMVQFLSNANALARRYGCLVLVVHHEGHTADRARGHSSFGAALDASLRIERSDDKLTSFISVKKVKDGEDDIRLKVMFRKQLLCCDEDGDPVTTLAVTAVEKTTEVASKQEKPKALPANSALMMDVIREQIDQMGQRFQPEKGAPSVKGVSDDVIRDEYYRRIAEQAEPGEDVERLASRKRKEFNRAIKNLLKGKHIEAHLRNEQRFLCLTSPAQGVTRTDTPKGGCPVTSRSPIAKGGGQSVTMSRNVTDVSLGLDYSDGDGAPDSTASTQADGMDELPASVPEGSNAIADAPDRLAESGEQHDSEDDAASRDFIVEPFYDDLPPSDPYDAAEGL